MERRKMARYTDSLLSTDERVLYRTRQHPLGRVVAARWGILTVLASFLVLAWLFLYGPINPVISQGIVAFALILCALGAARIAWIYLRWWAEDYVITSYRILKVEGILNKRSADSNLEKINDAILEQSLFGRLFDWGNLRILTAAKEVADDYHMLHHAPVFKKKMLAAKQDINDRQVSRITAPMEALNAREQERERREVPAPAPAVGGPSAPGPVPAAAAPAQTARERLQAISDLLDAGLITAEDYEAKKAAILATM
jgi:uncharacterized membrane protein YdbT with pleckstrin-like domain